MWGHRSRAVVASFGRRPTAAGLVRSFWPLGAPADGRPRVSGGDLAVDFLGSGDALLDRWFTSERLKAALAWFGAQSGPPMSEPGTAAMVGFAALLHDVPPGHPVGGSGGLTAALRRRLESDGGRVVLGDGAARLLVEDGRRVPGSRRPSGRRIAALGRGGRVPPRRRPARWRVPPLRPPWPTRTRRSATGSASSSARSPTPCPSIRARRPGSRRTGCSCCAPTGPTSPPRTATGRPAGCPATPFRWR